MKQVIYRAIGTSSAGLLMVSAFSHYRSLPEKSRGKQFHKDQIAGNPAGHVRSSDPAAENLRTAAAANAPAVGRK